MPRPLLSPLRAWSSLTALLLALVVVVAPVAPRPADAATGPVRMETVDVPAADPSFAQAGWAVSAPARVAPFAMVGIELGDSEATVEVRTAEGDGPWSPWVEVPHQHDEGPDPSSAEAVAARDGHRTHPVFTDVADRLQVRTSEGDPADLDAHLIDPFGLDRSWAERVADRFAAAWDGSPAAPAGALAAEPRIVSRAEWGADESLVRGEPAYARSVDRAFVHHTVGSNDYSQAQAPGVVRGIMAYHVNGNGWSDIGYNFLVDRYGTIYEGRAGGTTQPVIGAQAGGFNTYSTGVALMGTFSSATPDAAMVDAAARVIAWKADVHHFHPLRTGEATSAGSSRYPAGTVVTLPSVGGHRDVSLTACPGDTTYAQLAAIRDQVRALAGDLVVDHRSDVTRTRVIRGVPDVPGITFSADLDPPGEWAVEVRDPAGQVVLRQDGSGPTASAALDLTSGRWDLGTYEWSVSSPGRRTAVEQVAFAPPVIEGLSPSSASVGADREGQLVAPVVFSAELWRDATWELVVTAPDGSVAHRAEGQGDALDVTWADGATDPGTYTATVRAEDAVPATTSVEVTYDLFRRVADVPDAIGAAVAMSQETFAAGSADRAVIARHDVFADALAGGPLAGTGGPLLLTASDGLDDRVAAELDRVLAPGATIHVLGGPVAIGDHVLDVLRDRYGDARRAAGDSRVATAAAIARLVVAESGSDTAMIARAGPDDAAPWADALAGGAYGARAGVPVLLTATELLSQETASAIRDLDIEHTIVLGGPVAVDERVEDALPDPIRLAGDDRTATGVAIAEQLWGDRGPVQEVVLANGYDPIAWAWALAAAPLSATRGAPLLVTTPTGLPEAPARYLRETDSITGGVVLGPTTLVDPQVGYAASGALR